MQHIQPSLRKQLQVPWNTLPRASTLERSWWLLKMVYLSCPADLKWSALPETLACQRRDDFEPEFFADYYVAYVASKFLDVRYQWRQNRSRGVSIFWLIHLVSFVQGHHDPVPLCSWHRGRCAVCLFLLALPNRDVHFVSCSSTVPSTGGVRVHCVQCLEDVPEKLDQAQMARTQWKGGCLELYLSISLDYPQ